VLKENQIIIIMIVFSSNYLQPPENSLKKKNENRQVSEHELRIQRSLQRLNVPDWYKKYAASGLSGNKPSPSPTSNRDFGSGTGLAGGWSGLQSSKTASLTSLQSAGRYTGMNQETNLCSFSKVFIFCY
jgi:hypothetical protein